MLKWERTKQTAAITVLLLVLSCDCRVWASLALMNYDNDPNMAKAMEYDLAFCDYNQADRVKAEKYYLKYLKDVNESFQKVRVYDHIGALYATGFDMRKGERADYDKARYYFRKVLELEPERIAYPTIRARTMLASMEGQTAERVKARLDVYEWLLPIDEEKIEKNWLPLYPGNNSPTPLQKKKSVGLWKGLLSSTVPTNIMAGIRALPESEGRQYLLEISERFAGTELDKVARQHAAERGISLRKAPKTEVLEPEVEKVAEEVPEEGAGPAWTYWLLAGVIGMGMAIAAGVVVAVLLRKKTRAK